MHIFEEMFQYFNHSLFHVHNCHVESSPITLLGFQFLSLQSLLCQYYWHPYAQENPCLTFSVFAIQWELQFFMAACYIRTLFSAKCFICAYSVRV